MNGVIVGANKPPRLAPILKMPPPTPEFFPQASSAAAQYGPSELDANPSDRHRSTTVGRVPVTFEPMHTRIALSVRPTTGTMRRPFLVPYLAVRRSETQPPIGVITTHDTH